MHSGAAPELPPTGESAGDWVSFQMPGLNTAPRRAVPKLGEHTESVLAAPAGGPNVR